MAIQLINAILLLSAGFIAGNWFSAKPSTATSDGALIVAPTPHRTRTTSAPNSSRAPASVTSTLTSAENKTAGERPVDLAAYLLRFAISDVHEACEFAHNRFVDQTVAAHARFVDALENSSEHKAYLNSLGQRLAQDEKFWVGQGEIVLEDGKAHFEVVMDSHSFLPEADDEDNASCFRAHVRVSFVNGHDFSTVLDACSDSMVTKNRNYYLNWESFGDVEIGRKLAVVQIPLPESGGDLEYMRADDQTWAQAANFRWESVPLDRGLQMIDSLSPSVAQNRSGSEP